MSKPATNFRRLDSEKIIETVRALRDRIEDRFPGSGLGKVIAELLQVAQETIARIEWIQRPHFLLRAAAAMLTLSILALGVVIVVNIPRFRLEDFTNSMQGIDASISSVVFVGAAILFLVNWENRIKRNRALKAIHELRALAHIIDMHQLTKDPERYSGRSHASPVNTGTTLHRRPMSAFELNRYLDYCSDALALISKIAALYVQSFQDTVLLDAVDDVEDLTAGFSRKIWQKITILEGLQREDALRELGATAQFGPQTPP